jgi:K+-transporting ATPase ATPase C chain
LLLLTLLTGVLYPLAITGIAQVAMPSQANGSIIVVDGRQVGSALIGQAFSKPEYFWSRPSATTPVPYNGAGSTGSNLGPLHPALLERVETQAELLRRTHSESPPPIPVDLLTASGSGLDPHISPAAADYQVPRVARARGIAERRLRAIVNEHTEQRTLWILGEPRVNVLQLNLALDQMALE